MAAYVNRLEDMSASVCSRRVVCDVEVESCATAGKLSYRPTERSVVSTGGAAAVLVPRRPPSAQPRGEKPSEQVRKPKIWAVAEAVGGVVVRSGGTG